MTDLIKFIEGMPKCELHVHVEGTLEPEMKFALAARNGIALPYTDAAAMRAAYDFHDLPSFLKIYYEGMEVLVTEDDFHDLTFAYLAKAASQNVRYAEIFFDPQPHTARGVAFETVITGIHRAQVAAESELGIRSQLIMCFLRDWSAEFAMTTLVQALPFREWIVGVGLDSDEKDNPPLKFRKVFARAAEEGFRLTMHCDVNQEDSVQHIRDCVHEIGVDRIDHGVNALEDRALCETIREAGLALTICPISNTYCTTDSQSSVIRSMLELGMRVTVNSDDPAYFDGYISENFVCVARDAGLGVAQLVQLSRNAFEAAWLPAAERDAYLAELAAYAGT